MKVGDPVYNGSPSLPGVYCVRVKFASSEAFSMYDGTLFSHPHPTAGQAKAEQLVEGRLPATRTMRREDIEYWRTYVTEPTKTRFLALWRAAVDRLLGRA